ncbi:hypothetical protein DFP72DRAFT_68816 [Ephemerocybe angulata]|uniref:Uncharacterized protein n=1 Tax=Ephemerocybe angulata TaxID=980116 RepID=A0A8H6HE23_9AGAR|nr:hypothetical protein DFP72DRAFT_68816 [Tulosesus angulatus]
MCMSRDVVSLRRSGRSRPLVSKPSQCTSPVPHYPLRLASHHHFFVPQLHYPPPISTSGASDQLRHIELCRRPRLAHPTTPPPHLPTPAGFRSPDRPHLSTSRLPRTSRATSAPPESRGSRPPNPSPNPRRPDSMLLSSIQTIARFMSGSSPQIPPPSSFTWPTSLSLRRPSPRQGRPTRASSDLLTSTPALTHTSPASRHPCPAPSPSAHLGCS